MNELKDLYDASAQDLRFGIGLIAHEECEHIPIICIQYMDWPREVLEAVRDSMRSGIKLNRCQRGDGRIDLILETRERAQLSGCDGDHTGIIRFPSWDARLEGIEPAVLLQRSSQPPHRDRSGLEPVVFPDRCDNPRSSR